MLINLDEHKAVVEEHTVSEREVYVIIVESSKRKMRLKRKISSFEKACEIAKKINKKGVIDSSYWRIKNK